MHTEREMRIKYLALTITQILRTSFPHGTQTPSSSKMKSLEEKLTRTNNALTPHSHTVHAQCVKMWQQIPTYTLTQQHTQIRMHTGTHDNHSAGMGAEEEILMLTYSLWHVSERVFIQHFVSEDIRVSECISLCGVREVNFHYTTLYRATFNLRTGKEVRRWMFGGRGEGYSG